LRYAPGILLAVATAGCPSSGTVTPPDASSDGPYVFEGDAGAPQPDHWAPCSDTAHCISGSAMLAGIFGKDRQDCVLTGWCKSWQVDLFDSYPGGSGHPIAPPVLVAQDDSWAFDGVALEGGASSGYFVQASAVFATDAGPTVVSTVVGPLALGATGVNITLSPVQAAAYEARGVEAGMALDWVLARLYDPSSGAPITSGAQVSVDVAVDGGSTALTPTVIAPGTLPVYYAAFASPPPAQGTYTVTASHPAFGDASVVVQLVADPPTFDGTITSAAAGAGGALTVTWTPEPQAGYEVVEVFPERPDGGLVATPAYLSPAPLPPGQTSQPTGPLEAGTYLVNVAYTKANCPADAGGCVQAAAVAATTTTVP
jgi:hypothetical protein